MNKNKPHLAASWLCCGVISLHRLAAGWLCCGVISLHRLAASWLCCGVAAALMALTACSSDENPGPAAVPTITVLKSDLLFEPAARTGSVELSAADPITATLDASWCTATVSGSTVTVSVADNTSPEGRTALLQLAAGDARLQLPVQQRGMALGSLTVSSRFISNSGGRFSYYIRHDLPMQLTVDDNWLTAEMQGDSLIVNVQPNTSRLIRRATIGYESGGYDGELTVSQYDPKTNIEGAYIMVGIMGGQELFFSFDLYYENDSVAIVLDGNELWADRPVNLDFDPGNAELKFRSATYLYEKNSDYDAYYLYDSNGDVATSSQVSMTCRLFSNPLWSNATYAPLEDDGSWTGAAPLSGFLIRMVRAGGLVTNNLVQFNDPYIVRIGPIGTRP